MVKSSRLSRKGGFEPMEVETMMAKSGDLGVGGERSQRAAALLDRAQQELDRGCPTAAMQLLEPLRTGNLRLAVRMRYHFVLGSALSNDRLAERGEGELEHALRLAERLDDREYVVRCRYRLGVTYYQRLRFEEADGYFVSCWLAFDDGLISDPQLRMYVHHSLGNVALRLGNFKGAVSHYQDAIRRREGVGDSKLLGTVCWGLGLAHYHQRELGLAMMAMKEALNLQQRNAANAPLAAVNGMYAMMLIELNQAKAAERELKHTIYLAEQSHDYRVLVTAYGNLAEAYLAQDNPADALIAARFALEQAHAHAVGMVDMAQTYVTLAKVYTVLQRWADADANFEQAILLIGETRDEVKHEHFVYAHAQMLLKCGDYVKAVKKLVLAYRLNHRLRLYV